MSKPEIILDDLHRYFVDGVQKPGVTTIISSVGYVDTKWFTPETAQRGTDVHLLTQFHDIDDLEMDSVHKDYVGYLNGWIRFCKEMKFEPLVIEKMGYNERLNYCGTLDRIGYITVQGKRIMVLIDIKSGVYAPWWSLQTAGYENMDNIKEEYPGLIRYSVQVTEDGKYKLSEPCTNPMDFILFQSAAMVHNDKLTKGIIKFKDYDNDK